jgi:hypothetical protein
MIFMELSAFSYQPSAFPAGAGFAGADMMRHSGGWRESASRAATV